MRKLHRICIISLKKLYHRSSSFVELHRLTICNSLLMFLSGVSLQQRVYAGIISGPLCTAYNNVLDNQLVGVAAMASFAGIFLKWKFADKSGEAMTGAAKTGMAVSGLLSLPSIVSWFGATPC